MTIFEINTNGFFLIKGRTKEFYKIIFGGIFFYLSLLFATTYTINNKGYLMFLVIFLTVLYVCIFIFLPITLMIRINKVIRKIQINDKNILFTTNRELNYNKNEIEIKEVQNKFTGFSIKNKSGILLKDKAGKEYWIIEDFFNDYDELKSKISC